MIPESKYAKTCLLKTFCPFLILANGITMLTSIDFYDKLPFDAYEIQNVSVIRMLSSELMATDLPPPQNGPHSSLSIGHIVSKHSLQFLRENALVRPANHTIPIPHLTSPLKVGGIKIRKPVSRV